MSHYVKKCIHGVIVTQCRCIGPKALIVVPCPKHCKQQKNETPPPKEKKR